MCVCVCVCVYIYIYIRLDIRPILYDRILIIIICTDLIINITKQLLYYLLITVKYNYYC